jgi:hypothetical protein
MISNIFIFIMISILILIYFHTSNIDGFEKIYNINVNSTSGANNCACNNNSNPDVFVPVYGPWKTFYPWSTVYPYSYPYSYPYNWNYPYYWSQNYFW